MRTAYGRRSGRGLRNSGIRARGSGATIAVMKVALTGATGFIGSHVLAELQEHGHDVTAFVRDDAGAAAVAARGATPAVVDLYDGPAVVGLLREADAALPPARPRGAPSARLDSARGDAGVPAVPRPRQPLPPVRGLLIIGT